jgi:hypothetical protein
VPNWTPQQQQTLFTLAMLPSLGSCVTGGSASQFESQTLARINDALRRLAAQIGNWEVVWGPAVATVNGSVADNVMFAARRHGGDAGLPDLVVAIAGTNMNSMFDVIVEDALVLEQSPWQIDKRPAVAEKISKGAHIGLGILKYIVPQASTPGAGSTISAFLGAAAGANARVNLCGHSLGGALAATLALELHETAGSGGWNASHASLSVFAVAGPTAGNLSFALHSNLQIGLQVTRLYNPLDTVPLHWSTADLETIPNLYLPLITPDQKVHDFVNLRLALARFGAYTQIGTGLALPRRPPNGQLPPQPDVFGNFLAQMAYQHVDAYFDLLEIPDRKWIAHCG